MNLKLSELIDLHFEIVGISRKNGDKSETITAGLLKQKMALKLKFILERLTKITEPEFESFQKHRNELFEKYGEKSGDVWKFSGENAIKFEAENKSLLDTEKTIDVSTIWGQTNMIELSETIVTDENFPIYYKLIGAIN